MTSKVGYARVSTIEQNLDVQIEQLQKAGCDKIFSEKVSGTNSSRPELAKALDYVREGDTFIVARIDRAARSMTHFFKMIEALEEKKVAFVVTEQNIDTTTPEGRLMLGILASFAAFETDLRASRQAEGIAKAQREDKAKGVNRFGAPIKATDQVKKLIRQLKADNTPIIEIETRTGLSRATIYNILREKRPLESA